MVSVRSKSVLVAVLVMLLAACEGATGPAGPMGPSGQPGSQGPAGPGTRQVFSGTIGSQGSVAVNLPAGAGTATNPPVMGCYVSNDGNTWLVITDGFLDEGSPLCALAQGPGHLVAALVNIPVGWFYRIVIVY